jgi:MoaA/NifB/PqqE/SkfB family radical SAM enzyme
MGIKTNLADLLKHEPYIWLYYGSKQGSQLKRGICLLPWLQIFISVSGDVSPCCTLYPAGKKQEGGAGNLPAEGLGIVWNGEKMRALRKMFKAKKNYEAFKGCSKCNPIGFYSLFESLKMFPGIIKTKK